MYKQLCKKVLACFLVFSLVFTMISADSRKNIMTAVSSLGHDYIKWVDFDVTYQAMEDAMDVDIDTFDKDMHVSWIDILAYLATKYGGDFSQYSHKDIDDFITQLDMGKTIAQITYSMKYFNYYYKAYSAILGNFLGLDSDGNYGLIVYSPIAEGYWYQDSDDFGNGRSYGFARKHLGHDMFCSVGTPVAAVEGGKVEALGWNQYGGWRIGIRSNDGFRYYYYAHLQKDNPYTKGLKEGQYVKAGQIIGYSGMTGYSIKENVNNINVPHLHFGMQLIFDESQKDCNSEIWIDTYAIVQLLLKHKAPIEKQVDTSTQTSAQVPILMYHGLTNKSSQVNSYFIPVSTFESDLKYLKENGYTTITMNDLINYVYDSTGKISLPQKPIVLTFDDGYCNNLNLGSPLLKKYGMKAVISVIGEACEDASIAEYRAEDYCNVTWDQIKEMTGSGLWEVQNHTYNLHELKNGRKGASKKKYESEDVYEAMLKADIITLQDKLKETTGQYPTTFTWPFGAITKDAHGMLTEIGFKATLSCYSGINKVKKGDTECLYLMKRQLRSPNVTISSLLNINK